MLTFSPRKFLLLVGKLITFGLDALVIFTALTLILKWGIGERWELVAILNSVLHLMLIGAAFALIVNLVRRRWRVAVVSFVPVLYFLAVYGAAFLPDRIFAQPVKPDLRVLTYNIHSEDEFLDPMIALIREVNADVVALQELSVGAAERFTTEFADLYPYQAFHTIEGQPIPGQGVMSRYPITEDTYWRNEFLPLYLGHQRVQVHIDGTPLTLYNAHPIHPIMKSGRLFNTELRASEVQSVLDRAVSELEDNPLLMVGDFNMTDQSDDYRRVTSYLGDAYREAGWGLGFTFPDFSAWYAVPVGRALPVRPIARLDYQFYNARLRPLDAHVWRSAGGSDHRPVLVDYAFLR